MKEKLLRLGQFFWNYANSNLGAAVIGGAGAYVLTKGSREDELKAARDQLKEALEDNKEMKRELQGQEERVKKLADSWINTQALHHKAENKLLRCESKASLLKYAYDNTSFCLFRHRYTGKFSYEEQTVKANTSNQP